MSNHNRINERIRVPKVLLVVDGKNVGETPTHVALSQAKNLGLDLVEVSPNARPPVCVIMDYGKHQYEKQKKEKQKAGSKKEKEISFRYVIDTHDLETKANQIRRILEKDQKVKLVVKFKAREKVHKDKGFAAVNHLLEMIKDIAAVEKPPMFEGNNIITKLEKNKK